MTAGDRCRLTRAVLAVSASLAASLSNVGAWATKSEIDSFQTTVASHIDQDALAFIKAYPSSHLIVTCSICCR